MNKIDENLIVGCSHPIIERNIEINFQKLTVIRESFEEVINSEMNQIKEKYNVDVLIENNPADIFKCRVKLIVDENKVTT